MQCTRPCSTSPHYRNDLVLWADFLVLVLVAKLVFSLGSAGSLPCKAPPGQCHLSARGMTRRQGRLCSGLFSVAAGSFSYSNLELVRLHRTGMLAQNNDDYCSEWCHRAASRPDEGMANPFADGSEDQHLSPPRRSKWKHAMLVTGKPYLMELLIEGNFVLSLLYRLLLTLAPVVHPLLLLSPALSLIIIHLSKLWSNNDYWFCRNYRHDTSLDILDVLTKHAGARDLCLIWSTHWSCEQRGLTPALAARDGVYLLVWAVSKGCTGSNTRKYVLKRRRVPLMLGWPYFPRTLRWSRSSDRGEF